MTSSTLLRSCTLLLGFLSLFSASHARVLPKVKRDNATCCAFKITNRNNIQFLHEHIIDFSAMTSLDQVTKAGWGISNGWQIGGANPSTGQVAWASESNVKLVPGVGLTMTVPGRQPTTLTRYSSAEISFPWMTLGGYFEVTAKLSNVRGTTFDIFTIHGDQASLGWQDLQALKIASLDPSMAYLLNMDPSTGAVSQASPLLTSDSSQGFHTYSISWLPSISCPALNQPGTFTAYRFDGANLPSPISGFSTHPSQFIIAHFTNGDPALSAGPPASDSVVTIKQIRAYYDRPNKVANGACPLKGSIDCPAAIACGVTMM